MRAAQALEFHPAPRARHKKKSWKSENRCLIDKVLRLPPKMSLRHPNCCTCPMEQSSCPKSKKTDSSQNEMFDPFKATSKFTKRCACHERWSPKPPLMLTHTCITCQRFSNAHKVPPLHRDERVYDVLHLSHKMTFQTSNCPDSPALATKNKTPAQPAGKARPSEERSPSHRFVRGFLRERKIERPFVL